MNPARKWLTGLMALVAAGTASATLAAPDQVVKDATAQIQSLIRQHHDEFARDRTRFYRAVDEVVAPAFDVPYVAQVTLGRAWRTANDQQRARFQAAFKNTLIHAYSETLLESSGSSQIDWGRASVDGDHATVRAHVIRPAAPAVALAFELHRGADGSWRAYDISVEGISLITSFRSQFASEIKRSGLDALIQRLEGGAV